jgi:pyruvate kinase
MIVGDGSLLLRIIDVSGDRIVATALDRGAINPNRGITIQGSGFLPASLTEKDVADLEMIADSKSFDALALSFVSDPGDIVWARAIAEASGRQLCIIAKIETVQGLENLPSIAQEADIILAARGDLALVMDWIELPAAVMKIDKVSRERGKPWILATQIVEGMECYIFPTRAEICDLAFWLERGLSGVLLSYETVFGRQPIAAVAAVARMIARWGKESIGETSKQGVNSERSTL